jgi:hypothetical protein
LSHVPEGRTSIQEAPAKRKSNRESADLLQSSNFVEASGGRHEPESGDLRDRWLRDYRSRCEAHEPGKFVYPDFGLEAIG